MKVLINTLKYGQLGNRLFYQAHLIAYALETNSYYLSFGLAEYTSFLQLKNKNQKIHIVKNVALSTVVTFVTKAIKKLFPKGNMEKSKTVSEFVDEVKFPFVFLNKWNLHENHLMSKHRKEIVQILSFTENKKMEAASFIQSIRKTNAGRSLIGIHIRRGDYKYWKNGQYFFSLLEYQNTINQLNQVISNAYFVIFSDEKLSRKDFTELPDDSIFSNNSFTVDLESLSLCDFIAGPPSTFNAWASYIGRVPLYTIKNTSIKPGLNGFAVNNGNIISLTN